MDSPTSRAMIEHLDNAVKLLKKENDQLRAANKRLTTQVMEQAQQNRALRLEGTLKWSR